MFLIFDIGGTKMRLAGSQDLRQFGEPVILETPKKFEDGVALFKEAAHKILNGDKAEAIAGGIAGPFDERKRSLVGSPNLKDWIGKPFKEELENAFGAPLYIENDAALAGLGEAHFGAGRGYSIAAYITLSTGVGGARIVKGAIDQKLIGFEPGHQVINMEKGLELEDYIGGAALEKMWGKKPSDIDDREVWDKTARFLAYGLNNTIVHWSPEAVVLGGSLMNKIDIVKVEAHLKEILRIFPEIPDLKKAELGDSSGLYGAMVYLGQKSWG